MNLGFASAMRDITAETVRISTHSSGRKPPMTPEMMSARILTTTVHSPAAFLTGIMNRMTPTTDGMINRAFSFALLLVSILSPPSYWQVAPEGGLSHSRFPGRQLLPLLYTNLAVKQVPATFSICIPAINFSILSFTFLSNLYVSFLLFGKKSIFPCRFRDFGEEKGRRDTRLPPVCFIASFQRPSCRPPCASIAQEGPAR